MKRTVRFLGSIVTIVLFFLIPAIQQVAPTLSRPALAARNYLNPAEYVADMDKARNGEMNVHGYLGLINDGQWKNLTCAIAMSYGDNGCTNNQKLFPLQLLQQQSALGNIAMGIDFMYQNPPADLAYWVRDTAVSLGFRAAPAYAQGIGFQGLQPLLPIWKAFRNIAYLVIALALIIVGFMVMVRKRIDPKTVVTVQNSIPRIVVALILITFSYAIVGFMIDLMYVFMAIISIMFKTAFPPTSGLVQFFCRPPTVNLSNPGFMDFFFSVFTPLLLINPFCHAAADVVRAGLLQAAYDLVTGVFTTATGLSFLFQAILALCYLFAFIRLLFLLLGCYVQILLSVLTGPLQILLDAFPGGTGFTSWIKNLTANLIAFPIASFMILLANAITFSLSGGELWVAPFLPQIHPLGLPINPTGGLAEGLISLGIILVIPNVVKGIKDSFKAQPVASFGVNMGGALGTGSQILSAAFYMKEFTKKPQEVFVHPPPPKE